MPPREPLHLYEEILLLALRDREGTIASGTWYQHALGGALLAELLLEGRAELQDGKVVAGTGKPDDPLLTECLERIRSAKRRKKLSTWVAKLAGLRGLKRRAVERLCRQGTLAARRERVLLFFERQVYPELDPAPEEAVVVRLERALRDDARVDPRTTVLLALAYHTGILRAALGKKAVKERKKRILKVIEGDALGRATKQVIEATQAAVMAAVVVVVT